MPLSSTWVIHLCILSSLTRVRHASLCFARSHSSSQPLAWGTSHVTGSDGRILVCRVYDFDTTNFKHPYDVTFNVDVPAIFEYLITYVSRITSLAPAVRLINRQLMKEWKDVQYYGTVTVVGTRQDKDGEFLYCVKYVYEDNDYEEYSFLEIMRYGPTTRSMTRRANQFDLYFSPLRPCKNNVEITPFFGRTTSNLLKKQIRS